MFMKILSVLPLAATIAFSSGSASAQTIYQDGFELSAPDAYHDLPGVKDPATAKPKVRYTCRTELQTGSFDKRRYRNIFEEDLPVRGYRCEGGGLTYWGSQNPISKDWYPGVNPADTYN
ncbi:hypothetical protein [Agrobacterium sp.]|jgi:hypothetical protein|uniref:hypothetical protein n=1 Tax=Agrobacterium sp. TaxID=361 RepID=UPI0028A7A51F|nr:hypothetical protein [Agrobacterium sp.]